jgi:hypothetical protein
MTAVLVASLAGCVVAAALTFGVPLVHWVKAWIRVWTLAVSFGLSNTDSEYAL